MLFKAVVKDKRSKQTMIIEINQDTKKRAVTDIRANGYTVDRDKVKPAEVFDYIMMNTNAEPWDWKK